MLLPSWGTSSSALWALQSTHPDFKQGCSESLRIETSVKLHAQTCPLMFSKTKHILPQVATPRSTFSSNPAHHRPLKALPKGLALAPLGSSRKLGEPLHSAASGQKRGHRCGLPFLDGAFLPHAHTLAPCHIFLLPCSSEYPLQDHSTLPQRPQAGPDIPSLRMRPTGIRPPPESAHTPPGQLDAVLFV